MTCTSPSSTPPVPEAATARARLTAAITRAGLGNLTGLIPMNRAGVATTRVLIAAILATLGPVPPRTRVVPVRAAGVVGEWVLADGVIPGQRTVYYLHGSGYVICSARTHRSLAARLSAATRLPVFVVDYRLAPEHRFPSASDDVAAGFDWLLKQGRSPADIIIAGDSAGGHLACDLLTDRARRDLPPAAAAVLFSPLIDMTLARAELAERARRDPLVTAAAARRLVELYTGGQDPDDVRLRLDFTVAQQLPPFLIQVGGAEMLAADARHLAAELNAHGGSATLEVWPGLMHVFQALPRLGPEADAALLRVRDFLATRSAASPFDYSSRGDC